MKSQKEIRQVMDEVTELVLSKNRQYGDSALDPINIFAKGDATQLIRVRIDDKLNRLIQGDDSIEADEDIVKDLMGYLCLLLIAMRRSDAV